MPASPVESESPTPSPGAPSGNRFVVLLVALICSGAAGLTYQVLWLRLLSLVFGVTAYAASTVLAGFMAGLAIGSFVAGRVAARTRHPLRLFAAAEFSIAVAALVTHAVLERMPAWYGSVLAWTRDDGGGLTLARFAGALLVLLVPTSLMGATLPLVSASRLARSGGTAARVSAMYAANTAGAIAGVLLTGMYLIGGIGIQASFWVAAGGNALAGLIALVLARAEAPADLSASAIPAAPETPALRDQSAAARDRRERRAVLLVLALSGLASLALEVVWFRVLVLFIPATSYAFTTMLAAVLGGIAAGSWIAARLLQRERDWLAWLTAVQAWTSLVVLLSLAALAWTYGRGWRTSGQIQACVLAIFPAALLMGLAFPIALRIWARLRRAGGAPADAGLARDLGTAYAVNVCGAIAGAIVGGFLLLPRLGSRVSLIVCAALYLVSAAALAWVAPRRRRALVGTAVAGIAFVLAAPLVPDPFVATLVRRHGPDDRIFWREEGVQTTVSVHRQPGRRFVLFLDGLHQANDSPEMLQTHRLIGHLPMALHRHPARALVIGLGGGATAGAVSQHTGTAVDIVELSDSVRKGAEHFAHANYNVLRQPNVRLRVDDGRNYLLTTTERYDVVTADIIQPIHAGAGLLYSVEYFELARRVLKDDGLMLQWVGHRPDTQYRLLVRSFQHVFPYTTAWEGGTLLVGSKRPLQISREAFEAQRASGVTRAALDDVGLDSFEALMAKYFAGPDAIRAFVGRGGMLTDDRPLLEFHRSLPGERGDVDLAPMRSYELRGTSYK
jgi:spermidine synthase